MKKILGFYEKFKNRICEIISGTKAECSFSFTIPDVSSFTKEQKTAFNQMIDFLADMIEKYADMIPRTNEEAVKRLNRKSA